MAQYPVSIPTDYNSTNTDYLSNMASGLGHVALHNTTTDELIAIATKIGTGASTPTNGTVLRGNGTGTSAWEQVQITDITSFNSAALRAAMSDETGTGLAVFNDSPTLITPVIASFASAQHDHEDAAGGGVLSGAALTSTDGLLRDIHRYTYDGTDIFIDGVDQNNAANTATWTKPSGLKFVVVEVVGGGGGSGGNATCSSSQRASSSGGGGGGYSLKKIAAASLASTETITVGAGGTGATSGANTGGTGGTSSFGSHLQATGGSGGAGGAAVDSTTGASGSPNSGGSGGVGSGGDININGDDGEAGIIVSGRITASCAGGSSRYAGAQSGITNDTGVVGNDYGGGAGGIYAGTSSAARTGAKGGAGIVIVYEYF